MAKTPSASSAAFAAWRNSVARSIQVMKAMGVFVVQKGDADQISRAFNRAIVFAAKSEMVARVQAGEFADLPPDPGISVKEEWSWRTANIGIELERRGYAKAVTPDGVIVYRGEGREIALDSEGDWIYRDADETLAGDDASLRDLRKRISE